MASKSNPSSRLSPSGFSPRRPRSHHRQVVKCRAETTIEMENPSVSVVDVRQMIISESNSEKTRWTAAVRAYMYVHTRPQTRPSATGRLEESILCKHDAVILSFRAFEGQRRKAMVITAYAKSAAKSDRQRRTSARCRRRPCASPTCCPVTAFCNGPRFSRTNGCWVIKSFSRPFSTSERLITVGGLFSCWPRFSEPSVK